MSDFVNEKNDHQYLKFVTIFLISLLFLTLKIRYILRKIGKKKYSEEKYHEQTYKKNGQELDDFTEDFKA